jgi:hypothetical protein
MKRGSRRLHDYAPLHIPIRRRRQRRAPAINIQKLLEKSLHLGREYHVCGGTPAKQTGVFSKYPETESCKGRQGEPLRLAVQPCALQGQWCVLKRRGSTRRALDKSNQDTLVRAYLVQSGWLTVGLHSEELLEYSSLVTH